MMPLFLANLGKLMADIFRLLYIQLSKCCAESDSKNSTRPAARHGPNMSNNPTPSTSCNNTPRIIRRIAASDESLDISTPKHNSTASAPSPSLRPKCGRARVAKNVTLHPSAIQELVRRSSRPPVTESIFGALAGTNSILYKAMKVREESRKVHIPIGLSLVVFFFYMVGGAIAFSQWENWSYTDAIYFVFITISTIGFGDLIPGMEDTVVNARRQKLIVATVYLLLGLAMVCMCFDLMQLEIRRWSKRFAKRVGLVRKKN